MDRCVHEAWLGGFNSWELKNVKTRNKKIILYYRGGDHLVTTVLQERREKFCVGGYELGSRREMSAYSRRIGRNSKRGKVSMRSEPISLGNLGLPSLSSYPLLGTLLKNDRVL